MSCELLWCCKIQAISADAADSDQPGTATAALPDPHNSRAERSCRQSASTTTLYHPQSIMRNLTRLVHPEEKNSSDLIHSPRDWLGLNREDDYRLDKVPCGGYSRAADGKHFTSAIRHKNGDGCAQSILRRARHALGHFLYQMKC